MLELLGSSLAHLTVIDRHGNGVYLVPRYRLESYPRYCHPVMGLPNPDE